MKRLGTIVLFGAALVVSAILAGAVTAAPYAAMVVDARSGDVLHSRNADTRLHPASLTKMMTLYVAFEAVENGEISLDTKVKISKHAASEPPSKLYLKAGQRIALRDLIRAAAVKSANDAATAIGEAISGSESAFAARMNRTAKALGMTRTTFKNAHGLTQAGHLSTARDMTTLGRHLFYDYPAYYNLFSRRTTDAGGKTVANTNRRFLADYRGADGIKTGYTNAAGFNLVASAERGSERIIATVFGGASTAARNKRVAELLDMGFQRAPSRVAVVKPRKPAYVGKTGSKPTAVASLTPKSSARPAPRRSTDSASQVASLAAAIASDVTEALQEVQLATAASTAALPTATSLTTEADGTVLTASIVPAARPLLTDTALDQAISTIDETEDMAPAEEVVVAQAMAAPEEPMITAAVHTTPEPRPAVITFSSADAVNAPAIESAAFGADLITVTRAAGTGGWGIDIGLFGSRYEAERVLLKTALLEIETLDSARRNVERRPQGFAATFLGMNERSASLACQRLTARDQDCTTISP
ncbi:MAG: D-alanyl-D-alanine carboxypeptidase family protein [Qingshengfaniella sp.]